MNQRAGKTYKASGMDNGSDMKVYSFIKSCRRLLEEAGYEDPAFYFEQIESHMKEGKGLPSLEKEVSKILGL